MCHWAVNAWAEVPQLLAYQGRFTERDGSPLTGDHTITFRVYDVESGGQALWEEAHPLALSRDDNGIASIVLGTLTPLSPLSFTRPLWLAISIDIDGELLPRQRLTAVGYAINADTLDGLDSTQFARAGAVTTGESVTSAQITDGTIAAVDLGADSVGASALRSDAIQSGDLEIGDLPAHGATHQPGAADALPTAAAVSIGSANAAGASTSLARADHVHQGLHSLAVSGQSALLGDVTLAAGSNVTLTQVGQQISIASAGGGSSGNRVSTSAVASQGIGTSSDTTLLSVSITKSQAGSVLLVLATVQLNHTGNPNNKSVDVKLFRNSTQLDGTYTAHIGTSNRSVSELPVTLQAWDASGEGTYTFTLQARASAAGAAATIRRLSVIELS